MSHLPLLRPILDILEISTVVRRLERRVNIVIALTVEEGHWSDVRLAHQRLSDDV